MVPRNPSTKKPKAEKFPLTIKAGSASVKIYRERRSDGCVYFKVAWHLGGKRHKLSFTDLDKAKNEAQAKAAQLSRGDVDAMQLNGKDRQAYGYALEAIKALNIPLDAAAIEYAEAKKLLGSYSLQEASLFFMKHHGKGIVGKSVSEAYKEFLETMQKARRSVHYTRTIQSRVRRFAESFNCEVKQLAPQDVADWLNGLVMEPRSINNMADILKTFFKHCQRRKWLSKDLDLLEEFTRPTSPEKTIEIYTPKELRKMLSSADGHLATAIAIQAFAGTRSVELCKLTWEDTKSRLGNIYVAAHKAKTASNRLVPIQPNLASFLANAPRVKDNDCIWPFTLRALFDAQEKLSKKIKLPWKKNALRHSFVSYRLAQIKNMDAVANEAGNSAGMIFKHYRSLVTQEEAKEWFGILPAKRPKNIIKLEAAA